MFRHGRFVAAVLLLTAGFAAPAWAEDKLATGELAAAWAHYVDGRFLEAADAAEALATADGLGFAARANSAHAILFDNRRERIKRFERSLDLANRARALDPDHIEGHQQAVNALGNIARGKGRIIAYFGGYARRARALLDRVLALEPDNEWTHALLGAWHAEIVGLAPAFMARSYGADEKAAENHFLRAILIAPDNPLFRSEFAEALLVMSRRTNRIRAIGLMQEALALEPRDAFERMTLLKVRQRLAELSPSGKRPRR